MGRSITLAALVALSLCLVPACHASRSCTNQGQVHVPCEDKLVLEPSEKFLVTLMGHACYEIRLRSHTPLDVFFYEAQGSLYAWRLREMQALQPDIGLLGGILAVSEADASDALTANATQNSNSSVASDHLCDNSLHCHRIMHGLDRRGVYNLVMAYSRSGAEAADVERSEGILLSLESCDEESLSHVFGLLLVACMGFVSVMLCLCLLGEYALGLRSMTKFRRTLQRHHRFIELAQMDPRKDVDVSVAVAEDGADSPTSDTETTKCLVQSSRAAPALAIAPVSTTAAAGVATSSA